MVAGAVCRYTCLILLPFKPDGPIRGAAESRGADVRAHVARPADSPVAAL